MSASKLAYADHRADPAAWARSLGIAREAVELYLAGDVIDLHTDSFMWTRLLPGYDLRRRHRPWLPSSAFLNQVDLPRAREAQLTGVAWDVVANPFRPARRRAAETVAHIRAIVETLSPFTEDFQVVRTHAEYEAARAAGRTASLVSVQGGQAFDDSLDALDLIPDDLVHRITLVHLTESRIGAPNSQASKADRGLSDFGRDFVRRLVEKRILVDLAHINRKGFFDALAVMDTSVPPVVTHTGVSGVRRIWRNIDDDQIRAIAARGGTIGIIYHPHFLDDVLVNCPLSRVIDHLEHVVKVAGDDFASLGSDYDGFIWLPRELVDVTHQPKLVALMLERGWSAERIGKILGGNFLRVLRAVRPG